MSQRLCLAHNGIENLPNIYSIIAEIDFGKLENIFGKFKKNTSWFQGSWNQMGLSDDFDCQCFWYNDFSYINILINRDFYNWSFPVDWITFNYDLSITGKIIEVLSVIDILLKPDIFIFHPSSGNSSGENIQNCFFNGYSFQELVDEISSPNPTGRGQ